MKEASLTILTHSFSVDEIEKTLVFNFIQENGIDYSLPFTLVYILESAYFMMRTHTHTHTHTHTNTHTENP